MTFTRDDLKAGKEQLAKMPPRPWTNPWEENEEGEAEAIRDAEGKVVIGLGYYDGYHLEIGIEVCQIILAIINTLYPAALAALEEAWEALDKIYELCKETDAVDVWFTIEHVRDIAQALRAAEEKQQ